MNKTPIALIALACAVSALGCESGAEEADVAVNDTTAAGSADSGPVTVADAGLQTPESVLHDADLDMYLVSNINGAPLDKDGNGFISLVAPDGRIADLKWIDGAEEGVRLSAPKGMAISGDRLYVTDIDTVRVFDRNTGAPVAAYGIEGATFLNDLHAGNDGSIYVTDTGMRAGAGGFEPSGSAAVYHMTPAGQVQTIIAGDSLAAPNGLTIRGNRLVYATFGADRVWALDEQGNRSPVATLPSGSLDGLVTLPDGQLLVSSWQGEAVYRVGMDGTATPVAENIPSPADIAYDAQRNRLLIPVFNENRLEFRPLQ